LHAFASLGVFIFGKFRLDRRGGGLFREGEDDNGLVSVALGSRALDILTLLVERRGELVTKEEIFAAAWPEIVVEDSNLTVQIAALRRVLDKGRATGSCIQTVSGHGYRFVAPVTRDEPPLTTTIVPAYKLSADVVSGLPRFETGVPRPARARFPRRYVPAVMLAGVLIVGSGQWWLSPSPTEPPSTAPAVTVPAVAPRLSIVVLPFKNVGNDPEHQYFADGITEDLTADLSRIDGSFVISRNTAFTYKDKPVDAKQIGREVGVRYVLEGSIQRSDNRVRVNVQLIDAETDAHLWAERLDRDIGDLFALQNEVTSRIAIALKLALIDAEAARPNEHPDAMDYIFRGRAASGRPLSRDSHADAIAFFERALALDPRSVTAQTYLALTLANGVLGDVTDSRDADIERAKWLIEPALAASPRNPLAHLAKGQVLRAQGRNLAAIPEFETVLASDRNSTLALFALGLCKLFTGSIQETIPLEEQVIRLNPRDPGIGVSYSQIGRVHLLQSRIDEAIVWLEKARNANPALSYVHGWLAAAYALKGESERAAAELAEARGLSGNDRFRSIARLKGFEGGFSKIQTLVETTILAGLCQAGVPEE
jgi:adenylate cyclase